MKAILLAGCILAALLVRAQDTIVYKSAGKLAVQLKEITPSEIRYQRLDVPNGPDYVVSKSMVDRIIYKNGLVEVISAVATIPALPPKPMAPAQLPGMPFPGKIGYRDTKSRYPVLLDLAGRHADVKRRPELEDLAFQIKQAKATQEGTRTGAIVCGGLAVGGTLLYGFSQLVTGGSDQPVFYIPPIALSGLAVALGSVSVVYSVRLRHKRTEFVDLYNE